MLHVLSTRYCFVRYVTLFLDTVQFCWTHYTFVGEVTLWKRYTFLGHIRLVGPVTFLLDMLHWCWAGHTWFAINDVCQYKLTRLTSPYYTTPQNTNTLDVPLWCLCTALWWMFRRFGDTFSLHLQGEFSINLKQSIQLEDGNSTFLRYIGILH
jgi:hypothetical protein